MKPIRRHKNDTKAFDELTFREQAQAMNMTALQFRKQLNAHLRQVEDPLKREEILDKRLTLLERIIEDHGRSTGKVRITRLVN